MSHRHHSCFTTLIAVVGFVLAGSAGAQTCVVPANLVPNQMFSLDTCQGDSDLLFVCGVQVALTGPALIVRLDLPYPVGRIAVQSLDANFNPSVFLLRSQCRKEAMCDAVEFQSPAPVTEIELANVDSGSHFLVVAPALGDMVGASCGAVQVHWSVEQQDVPFLHDGIFHSGVAPIWEPKP